MKRKIALLLVAMMLMASVVACTTAQEKPAEAPAETTEAPAEAPAETTEAPAEATEAAAGEIATIGLGSTTSTVKSADSTAEKAAGAQADVTIAAVAFDAEGKIVKVQIDVAQTRAAFLADNTNADLAEGTEYKSKMELGADYGMLKASGIGKEYNEQLQAFMDYIVGMTAEEVKAIPTKVKDDAHQNVPDVADLASTVTIDIGGYVNAVVEASENTVDAAGATKLGLGIKTDVAGTAATPEKPARAQVNTYMNAIALDDAGAIVANIIDVVQAKVDVDAEGKIVERSENVETKKDLKERYGMTKASAIGKDWFEQMAEFEKYTIGKTIDDINGIPVTQRDENHVAVPDVPELTSTVTITIDGYQAVMTKAVANAK